MTRALCACGCGDRVKRNNRKYASRECSAAASLGRPNPGIAVALATNRARTEARVLAELRALVAPHVDASGRVPLAVAIRCALAARNTGYSRGWGAAWLRARRTGASRARSAA